MNAEPQIQHRWLDKFIGTWTSETEFSMEPNAEPSKATGTEVVRSIGGVWIVAEGTSDLPDGGVGTTIMTLGFDPRIDRFVGTFIGSMMTHLWVYNGSLDPAQKVLTLDTEGLNFSQTAMAKYQDIIEFVSDDHRVMKSQILMDDGTWNHFMTAHYRRQ
ncbi:DUF1579 domain-containing protein [Chamaesiphon minutus]|uniref:DUF1579 domain-containing protein n=1 Tax=Chamaesiphon minutus (strain ATCC 27169 / PCC 6605) TaxID=1173020 RepID=K9UAG2_CHAP6|nr:DUF1579 domain-containing protein [Chamaesiphon minutus]AFY92107.1 Protein of unknown function (DUF1579) [Chamaesiphon minutus PCC 6605]